MVNIITPNNIGGALALPYYFESSLLLLPELSLNVAAMKTNISTGLNP
jgi:hypothetical protein